LNTRTAILAQLTRKPMWSLRYSHGYAEQKGSSHSGQDLAGWHGSQVTETVESKVLDKRKLVDSQSFS
jgi:hypothetical protein